MKIKLFAVVYILSISALSSQIKSDSVFYIRNTTDVFFNKPTSCKEYYTQKDGCILKECYYSNGQKAYSAGLFNGKGNGQVIIYYPNGVMESMRSYVLGVEAGTWIEWYENGKIKSSGSYTELKKDALPTKLLYDSALVDSSMFGASYEVFTHYNTKEGEWHYYNETGTEETIKVFSKGVLIEQRKKHRK